MHKFTFHFLGMPHTTTHPMHSHCAYTMKVLKALKMFSRRGHRCIDYSNEGALVPPGVEHVDIFTEAERASYFGAFEKQKLHHIDWDPSKPYWVEHNRRLVEAIKPRVSKGDFLMTLSGNCQVAPVGDAFPGSYGGTAFGPMMVEWGIGYYGTQSVYRVFESHSHREWVMGAAGHKVEANSSAVVHNFFDVDDFPIDPPATERTKPIIDAGPYYLFLGRVIQDKGIDIALDTMKDLGGHRFVIAGSGEWSSPLPPYVTLFGHANIEERASLMANAVALMNPTKFREPFGGTAVEAQFAATPAITTDQGAFCETVRAPWRCASHREFLEAARYAQTLSTAERRVFRVRAKAMFSLEAIAPQYERYFQRLMDRWGAGWFEKDPVDPAEVRTRP
jgi:glycosyltransferase involved in cell wall biosynthesis